MCVCRSGMLANFAHCYRCDKIKQKQKSIYECNNNNEYIGRIPDNGLHTYRHRHECKHFGLVGGYVWEIHSAFISVLISILCIILFHENYYAWKSIISHN